MHVDVIEILRCPRPHEESWLVAAFGRMAGRHVVEGELGCPVCETRYPIERGVVRFDRGGEAGGLPLSGSAPPTPADATAAFRAAALLGLADGGGVVMLSGSWAVHASEIALITEDVQLLLHDPDWLPAEEDGGAISAIVSPGRLPVAAGALRGVALGASEDLPALLEDAVRALRPGGRLVAPASARLPAGVAELARDERDWVAERRTVPTLVPLGRGGR